MLRQLFAFAVIGATFSVGGTVEAATARTEMVANRPARTGFFSRLMEAERRKNERIREWFRGNR
jgi:hypothetical protein